MYDQKPKLGAKLAHLLSDVVTLQFLFQGYHWNVLGPDFGEMHNFFGMLYEDVEESIDPLAENILKVGYPAPYLLSDYTEMSCIKESRYDGRNTQELLTSALRANEATINCYNAALKEAEACNEQGLMDFLAGRVDMHIKWRWQMKAYLGER